MAGNLIADLIADFKNLGTLAKANQDDLKTLEGLRVDPEELDEGPLASIISPLKKTYRDKYLKLTSDIDGAIELLKNISEYCDNIIKWLDNFREIKEHSKLMELFNNTNQSGETFSSQIDRLSQTYELYLQKVGISLEGEESLITASAELVQMLADYKKIVQKLEKIKSIRGSAYKDIKEMFVSLANERLVVSVQSDKTSIDQKIKGLSKIDSLLDVAEMQIFKKLNGTLDSYRIEIIRGFFIVLVSNLREFNPNSSNEYLNKCLIEKVPNLQILKYENFEVDIKNIERIEYKDSSGKYFKLLSTSLLYLILISPKNLSLNFEDLSSRKEVSKKISELTSESNNIPSPPPPPPQNQSTNP